METFEQNLIKKLGRDNLRKIRSAHVGIAGAGGLGSNCAMNLVRVGFRKLTIIDFDEITLPNLDRQFYFLDQVGMSKVEALEVNLLRINSSLEIKTVKTKIEPDNIGKLFTECDIIAECLDKAQAKTMLVEGLLTSGKFIVGVSGLGGVGSSDNIIVHKVKENLLIIGDLQSDISYKPAISPRVNVAAAKQADEILNYVIKNNK